MTAVAELETREKTKFYLARYQSFEILPILDAPSEEVAYVPQKHVGLTSAQSDKPILATDTLHTCVGLMGHDKENEIGFLMHLDARSKVYESFFEVVQLLEDLYSKSGCNFDIHTIESGFSWPYIILDLEVLLAENFSVGGSNFNFKSSRRFAADPLDPSTLHANIALDVRTGKHFSYSPKIEDRAKSDYSYLKHLPTKAGCRKYA